MKSYKRKKRLIAVSLSLVLLLVSIIGLASCAISYPEAESLMDSIKAQVQETKEIEDDFIKNTYEFSTDLFKRSIDMEENSLVSPLSVLLALAMTANGADTLTLEQMEDVLGMGTAIEDLNSYLYSYVKGLPSSDKAKLSIANSIWFRDDEGRLTIEEDFLQTNANFYGADIFKAAFDGQTVKDINKWVEDKTDGMIDQILEDIGSDHIMYLLNAIAFDAEWSVVYNKDQIISSEFQAISGEKQAVDLMNSEEDWYLDDGKATGFIKPYHGGHYSFVALLPNEDIPLDDYIDSLTGETLMATIKGAEPNLVYASLPKFSYEYEIKMNDALIDLGMPNAFEPSLADFCNLGDSTRGNIFCEEVFHKSFISVDELGTKAGAVTKVVMSDEAYIEGKYVRLDRPFVYAIVDKTTSLPIFIGTVVDLEK